MAILSGTDEGGAAAFYDIPDAELSKYALNLKPMTDEVRNRLFPGKDTLTKEDAQGVVPAGRVSGEVEGYAGLCWYWVYHTAETGWDDYYYWQDYC